MITNFVSDTVASAISAVAALPLREGAIAYLAISLLGPLCWIATVEICRFVRMTKNIAPAFRTAPAVALMAATRRHLATPGLLDSPLREN